MSLKYAFIFWAVMVLVAIANGIFSHLVVTKLAGDYIAHLYRVFFAVAVIFAFAFFYTQRFTDNSPRAALFTGLLWLSSSLVFEFIFGHFVFRISWETILNEYRLAQGRLWALVLTTETLAPALSILIRRHLS